MSIIVCVYSSFLCKIKIIFVILSVGLLSYVGVFLMCNPSEFGVKMPPFRIKQLLHCVSNAGGKLGVANAVLTG